MILMIGIALLGIGAVVFGIVKAIQYKGRKKWLAVLILFIGACLLGFIALCLIALQHFGEVARN